MPDVPDLIDEQKIGTAISQRAIDRVWSALEVRIRSRITKNRNASASSYAKLISRQKRQVSRVRPLIIQRSNVDLSDVYIQSRLRTISTSNAISRMVFETRAFSTDLEVLRYLVSTRHPGEMKLNQFRPMPAISLHGRAGTGKSMFARMSYLTLTQMKPEFIPLFVELRELNRLKSALPFDEFLYKVISDIEPSIDEAMIKDGLEAGLYALVFDGFDEIDPEYQVEASHQLRKFATRFDACPILVTGRPMNIYGTWSEFESFDILPLDKARAKDLIQKVGSELSSTERFLQKLEVGDLDDYSEFFENPLLLTIMQLTFDDTGKISKEKHEFLADALDALWRKHDARKDGYERRHFSRLDRSAFSSFAENLSILTYSDNSGRWRETEFRKFVDSAKKNIDAEERVENLKNDLVTSTSIMLIDGNEIRYSHRYFEEYLCAMFLSNTSDELMVSLLDFFAARYESDNVFELLLSINKSKFTCTWLVKKIKDLSAEINEITESEESYNCSLLEHISNDRQFDGKDVNFLVDMVRKFYRTRPDRGAISYYARERSAALFRLENACEDEGIAGKKKIEASFNEADTKWRSICVSDRENLMAVLSEISSYCESVDEFGSILSQAGLRSM